MSAASQEYLFEELSKAVGVMVVSGNAGLRQSLLATLKSPHWRLEEAASGAEALEKMESGRSEILLLDPALSDLECSEFKLLVQSQYPYVQIVTVSPHTGLPLTPVTTASKSARRVIDTLEQLGTGNAAWFSPAPSDLDERNPSPILPGVLGTSQTIRRVASVTHLVARRDTTVLITGASGTGKDLVARAIHSLSPRHANPFVVINCAAIPEALLEAELFGYVRGAFTGAVQSRVGRIHSAQGGTLFLDEIGDMPLGLQSKILRFLEQGEVQRLGSSDVFRVDVRVVAATNADLRRLVQEQKFREDLFYRLAVFPIELPPLKNRIEDVPALALSFLEKFSLQGRSSFSQEALAVLQQHTWPGNVRELRNVIERACILAGESRQINPEHVLL